MAMFVTLLVLKDNTVQNPLENVNLVATNVCPAQDRMIVPPVMRPRSVTRVSV